MYVLHGICTLSRKIVISSVLKHFCAVVLELGLWVSGNEFRSDYFTRKNYIAERKRALRYIK